MKRIIITTLVGTGLALTSGIASAERKELNATRSQVAAACTSSGGTGYGTGASSGGYGCYTDKAWIDCDEDGKCVGERHTERKQPGGRFGAGGLTGLFVR
jgi:hypothetical protein